MDLMKFFNVKVTDLSSEKVKTNITVPLFIVVLAGNIHLKPSFDFCCEMLNPITVIVESLNKYTG